MHLWNVLHAARWKYRTQNLRRQNRHLCTIAQLCRAISSQLRHISTIGKEIVKQRYLLHVYLQYGKLRPTNRWDRFVSFGHPSKFQRVSRFGFVTPATSLKGSQPNFARCLAISWAGTLDIHFGRLLPCNGILPGASFTMRPSHAFSYIGSVTARHSNSGRQPNFVELSRGRHLCSAGRPSRWAGSHCSLE